MRLANITVQKFRNFVEAQRIEIEDDVTCLVGKNESGKTTILRALHRLNPANGSDATFDLTTEYPRWRLARDRRQSSNLDNTRPIEAEFVLDNDDLQELENIFGVRPPASMTVHVGRTYANEQQIWLDCEREGVLRAAAETVEISGADLEVLLTASTHEEANTLSKEKAKTLKDDGEALRGKAMSSFVNALGKYSFLTDSLTSEQSEALSARLPKFFYFSTYNILPGETDLNELQSKIDAGTKLADSERSVVALARACRRGTIRLHGR